MRKYSNHKGGREEEHESRTKAKKRKRGNMTAPVIVTGMADGGKSSLAPQTQRLAY